MSILLDTINKKPTSRPPVWFLRQAGRVLPSYLKLREKHSFKELMHDPELASEVSLLPVYDLGVDAAILFSDILVIPEALGMKLEFTDKGPRFEKALKDVENIFSSLKPNTDFLQYIYKAIDCIIKNKPADIPLIGFCGSPFTTFCYMMQGLSTNHSFPDAVKYIYSSKKEVQKLFEIITEISIEYALNQVKHGISVFQIFETHAGLLPIEVYNEMILPHVKKLSHAIMQTNTPVIFFPKGFGTGLKYLSADDFDYISIDWQIPLQEARNILDKNLGVQGNLDPRLLLADKDVILEKLEKYLSFGEKNTNWIFNLGHGFIQGIPFENAKFVVDWIKETKWR